MSIIIDYPNPVLSAERDDYIEGCKFDVSFVESEIVVDENNIRIPAKLDLVCAGLSDLIKKGQAVVVVLINSSASFFRKTYVFSKDEHEKMIDIPKYSVKRNIEFTGYILAAETIKDFYCDAEFNELYFKNIPFLVEKADVLAKGQSRIIPIDDSELEKPISSIFTIIKNSDSGEDIETDFEDEKIIIKLSERLNALYWEMKDFNNGSFRRYLTSVIVFPSLVEAIEKICNFYNYEEGSCSEKRWFRAIEYRLSSDFKIDLSQMQNDYSYVQLADKLLGGIAFDGLKSAKDTIDQESNNGEYVNIGGID